MRSPAVLFVLVLFVASVGGGEAARARLRHSLRSRTRARGAGDPITGDPDPLTGYKQIVKGATKFMTKEHGGYEPGAAQDGVYFELPIGSKAPPNVDKQLYNDLQPIAAPPLEIGKGLQPDPILNPNAVNLERTFPMVIPPEPEIRPPGAVAVAATTSKQNSVPFQGGDKVELQQPGVLEAVQAGHDEAMATRTPIDRAQLLGAFVELGAESLLRSKAEATTTAAAGPAIDEDPATANWNGLVGEQEMRGMTRPHIAAGPQSVNEPDAGSLEGNEKMREALRAMKVVEKQPIGMGAIVNEELQSIAADSLERDQGTQTFYNPNPNPKPDQYNNLQAALKSAPNMELGYLKFGQPVHLDPAPTEMEEKPNPNVLASPADSQDVHPEDVPKPGQWG